MLDATLLHTPLNIAFRTRVLPVAVVEDASCATDLAYALLEGGIDAIEITLRSTAALRAIERIARDVPSMVVGAGTVLTPAQLQQVHDAGARFALSPGSTPALLDAARGGPLPFVPGVATPSEAMLASDAGFGLLKCFPAESLGGLATLKAWAGPLPHLRWCPTGGINQRQLGEYLKMPNVAMVGGSWITPLAAIAQKAWNNITELARQAADIDAACRI